MKNDPQKHEIRPVEKRSEKNSSKSAQKTPVVAILFASGRSIYKYMPNTLVFDRTKDARNYTGKEPVIAHPPCRTWSKFLRHTAKPKDWKAEQSLAFFALEKVQTNGGVLEQPASSHFWETAKLPMPSDTSNPFFYTIQVEQSWFAGPIRKKTWLLICGVPRQDLPEIPFQFEKQKVHFREMTKSQRSATPKRLATWLLEVARLTWWQYQSDR